MKIKCPNCKTELMEKGSIFCPECGNSLTSNPPRFEMETKEAVIMTDLKCLTLSALIAEKIAKFLLNQEEISQFCVVLVLEEMMAEEMKDQEEKTEIQEAEEKKKECTMLFAVNVVEILNYHLDLLEIEPYTAKDALMEVKKS